MRPSSIAKPAVHGLCRGIESGIPSLAIIGMSQSTFAAAVFALAAVYLELAPSHDAQAQSRRYAITGTVTDSTGAPLRDASVSVHSLPDSVLAGSAVSSKSGTFLVRGLLPGNYWLEVDFIGMQTSTLTVTVSDADVAAGSIMLAQQAVELEEILIQAEPVPFATRGDTVEYYAAAYASRWNDVVEDLLRKLPGVRVYRDGTIRVYGEIVGTVLVDGKEFFGSDPSVATENLPAHTIARVQVYYKESDLAAFTGIPDGNEVRAINLVLKDEAKRGYFGRIGGGVGAETQQKTLYDGEAKIYRFTDAIKLTLTGDADNRNPFGDGFARAFKLDSRARRDNGNGSWVHGSYSLDLQDSEQDGALKREEVLGSEVFSRLDRTSHRTRTSLAHQLSVSAHTTFAKGHDLRLNASLDAASSSATNTTFQRIQDGASLARSTADTTHLDSENGMRSGEAQLTWRRRLNSKGTALVAEAQVTMATASDESDLNTRTRFYDAGATLALDQVLQNQMQLDRRLIHKHRWSVTHPIATGHTLELYGQFYTSRQEDEKTILDLEEGIARFNDRLSLGLDQSYRYIHGGLRLGRRVDGMRAELRLEVKRSDLTDTVLDLHRRIHRPYTHFLPRAFVTLDLSERTNLRVRYQASTRAPTLRQLQPYVDNANPLIILVGNPDLEPEYGHSLSVGYRYLDKSSLLYFSARTSITYTQDDIASSRSVDEQLRQVRTYVNAKARWERRGSIKISFPITRLGIDVDIGNELSYSTGSTYINSSENRSRRIRNTVDVEIYMSSSDDLEIFAVGQLSLNRTDYSLNERLEHAYQTAEAYAGAIYGFGHGWEVSTVLAYQLFDNALFGSGRDVADLETELSWSFLDDRASLRLVLRDMLNQNLGVTVSSTSTYIEEERIPSLGRHLVAKFTYRFSPVRR